MPIYFKEVCWGSKLQVNEKLVQIWKIAIFIEVEVTFLKWVIWAQDFWWGLVSSRTSHASMEYSYLLVTSELCLLSFVCKKIVLVLDGLSSSKKIFLIESSTIDHFGWVKHFGLRLELQAVEKAGSSRWKMPQVKL